MKPKHIKMVKDGCGNWETGKHDPIAEDWDSWCYLFNEKLLHRCGEKRPKTCLQDRCEKKRKGKNKPAPILLKIDYWKYHGTREDEIGGSDPRYSFRTGLFCSIKCPHLGILTGPALKARAMFKGDTDER